MDHDNADIAGEHISVERLRPVPAAPVVVSVCISCKAADTGAIVGPEMFDAVKAALANGDGARYASCASWWVSPDG